MKIAVMGYSGAGKSTLAKKLGRLYDCPVLYLDRIQFEPGWKERNREEAKRMAEGCREKIDWDFVKWILRDGRDENHSYRSIKARYPHKTLVVRNRKQLKDSMTRLILRSRERTLG